MINEKNELKNVIKEAIREELDRHKGTIAHVFKNRKDELFTYMQSKSQFNQLHQKVLELLDDPELKNNKAAAEAKSIFNSARNNYNKYLSILTTYMTGKKVG